ncbi:MAG: leucine-rich repeat protein [Clostridia bacterium]|nr:leucine-rich repeat protein [Clostridia bacterium]
MKKKIFLMLTVMALLVCLFTMSVSADEASVHAGVDKNATVTLSDGTTVLPLFDAEENALIWFKDAESDTGYSSIRADIGISDSSNKVDFQVNNWAELTYGVMANQVDTLVIVCNGVTISNNDIVVFNIMDDDVKVTTSKKGNAPVGSIVNCITNLFNGNTNIQYAYLRLDTNSVQGKTFFNATNLKYVNLENLTTLTRINSEAFRGCTSLFSGETLDLSKTDLRDILGGGTFANVPMTGIKFPDSITSLGGTWVFQGTAITSVTIPASVTTIPATTFKQCKSLETVIFEGEITTIGQGAFYQCEKLKNFQLPSGLVRIEGANGNNDEGTFEGCTSLTEITIPATVTHIYGNTFTDCTALKTVTFEKRDGTTPINFYGWGPFLKCTSLTELILPEGMTEIPNCFATQCYALEKISFPSTLTTIRSGQNFYQAGKDATKLEVIGLENTKITSIPKECFRQSKFTATELRLPNTVTEIGTQAFADCKIETFYLSASLTTIGSEALAYNSVLKAMYIPSTVTTINANSFTKNKGDALYIVVVDDPASTVIDTIETAVQSGKEESAYIKYADYSANPSNYTGKNIVYGGNLCVIFYKGVHNYGDQVTDCTANATCERCLFELVSEFNTHNMVESVTYPNGIFAAGTYKCVCTNASYCRQGTEELPYDAGSESAPIIVAVGYSIPTAAVDYFGINAGYQIQKDLFELYQASNPDTTIEVALFMVNSKIGTTEIEHVLNGKALELATGVKGLMLKVESMSYDKINIEVRNFDNSSANGSYYTLELISALVVKETKGEDVKLSFVQSSLVNVENAPTKVIDGVTYNIITAEAVYNSKQSAE